MANNRRLTTTAATALLAGSAVAAAAVLARRRAEKPRAVVPALELTPSHRGGTGTPLLLLHGIGAIWRAWSPVLPYLEPHHDVIVPTLAGHGGGPPLDPGVMPSVQALVDGIEDELDRWACRKCISPGTPSAGGSESSLPDADGRNPWCCSAHRGLAVTARHQRTGNRRQVLPRRPCSLCVPGRRDRRHSCCTGRCWPVR